MHFTPISHSKQPNNEPLLLAMWEVGQQVEMALREPRICWWCVLAR
jgi:hypothetical protein